MHSMNYVMNMDNHILIILSHSVMLTLGTPQEPSLPEYSEASSSQNDSRFSQLKNSLLRCDNGFIIDLLVEELEKTDGLQRQLIQTNNTLNAIGDQKQHLRISLGQKRLAFRQLEEAQQRNVDSIQSLEKQLGLLRNTHRLPKEDTPRQDSPIQKKYRELTKFMNQFVSNTADIQEEFKRNLFILKNQNIRLNADNQNLSLSLKQHLVTIVGLQRQAQNVKILQRSSLDLKTQNGRLIKEIRYHQEVERDLYEGVASIQTQRLNLQKQLVRTQEICHSNNLSSREISGKYQQLVRMVAKYERQREIIADNCMGSNNKISQLEDCIQREHMEYQSILTELEALKDSYRDLSLSNEQLTDRNAQLETQLLLQSTSCQNLRDQKIRLENKVASVEKSNLGLREMLSKVQLQRNRQQSKSALICTEVQNFLRQPTINCTRRGLGKSNNDLSNTKSLKTMATSVSQSQIDRNQEHTKLL